MPDPIIGHVGRTPASPARRRIVGKIAASTRYTPDADITELHRDLKAQALEDHIRALVETAPALTDEQRERLAALLWNGGNG